jgi:hypothetical protein
LAIKTHKKQSACNLAQDDFLFPKLWAVIFLAVADAHQSKIPFVQANEYEVLMILMGECRTRLGNYEGGVDDELRFIKNKVWLLSN